VPPRPRSTSSPSSSHPSEPGRLRRGLAYAAVGATLLGLPLVLLGGSLLRHVGHVAPSTTNAAALRLRVLAHGVACAAPVPESPPADGAASALTCTGPDGVRLRLVAFRNPAARTASFPSQGAGVAGANWRIEIGGSPSGPAENGLADRLATALTGKAYRIVYRASRPHFQGRSGGA
jgi:hypothetical protein